MQNKKILVADDDPGVGIFRLQFRVRLEQIHRALARLEPAAPTVERATVWVDIVKRGLDVREIRHDREGAYHTLVAVEATTSNGRRRVAGTLFGAHPRLVELFGIEIEAELEGAMLYIVNTDTPGFIGKLGTALGAAGINIATFNLGRRKAHGDAASLVAVDGEIGPRVVETLCALDGVRKVVPLRF